MDLPSIKIAKNVVIEGAGLPGPDSEVVIVIAASDVFEDDADDAVVTVVDSSESRVN